MEINECCDPALPPQALQLRQEGDAGQLGGGHHLREGKMTRSREVGAEVMNFVTKKLIKPLIAAWGADADHELSVNVEREEAKSPHLDYRQKESSSFTICSLE